MTITTPLSGKTLPGIYRARCARVEGDTIWAEIPQVFGVLAIPFASITGEMPVRDARGWVAFEGGQADRPVWISAYHPAPEPILVSPNGTRYRVVVADNGALSTVAV